MLQTQRLRTTWLVELLNASIPLKVILKASGLGTLHSLSRYLVLLHDVPEAEASDLLRGHEQGEPGGQTLPTYRPRPTPCTAGPPAVPSATAL